MVFVRQILRSVFCKNFLKVVQLDGNVFEAGSSGWSSPSEVAESWRSSFSGCNDARDPRELVHRIAQASFLQMSAVPNWNFNMLSKSCCSVNHPESKSKLGYSSTLSRLGCVSDLQGCLPRVEFELYMLPVQTYLKHVQVHAGRMQNTLQAHPVAAQQRKACGRSNTPENTSQMVRLLQTTFRESRATLLRSTSWI